MVSAWLWFDLGDCIESDISANTLCIGEWDQSGRKRIKAHLVYLIKRRYKAPQRRKIKKPKTLSVMTILSVR